MTLKFTDNQYDQLS